VPLSARGAYRLTLSITVTLRPPCLRAFYGFRVRVVNPVTIEPQYLEDRDPWRTHMRAAIRVGPRCTDPHGSARNILTPQGATAVCVRMADAGDATPRSLVERID
jgi:hypothetical protein